MIAMLIWFACTQPVEPQWPGLEELVISTRESGDDFVTVDIYTTELGQRERLFRNADGDLEVEVLWREDR
jgi:hypothetical protein